MAPSGCLPRYRPPEIEYGRIKFLVRAKRPDLAQVVTIEDSKTI